MQNPSKINIAFSRQSVTPSSALPQAWGEAEEEKSPASLLLVQGLACNQIGRIPHPHTLPQKADSLL